MTLHDGTRIWPPPRAAVIAFEARKMPKPGQTCRDGSDASQTNGSVSHSSGSETTETLLQICLTLRRGIVTFLEEDHTDDKVLRNLQGHVRVAMDVIREAFHRYG